MALTKVRGSGLGTLGDGTASDTAIVFDGNAQDFHIGLDDSTDSLTMGLGSTLGTTSHMVIDANGQMIAGYYDRIGYDNIEVVADPDTYRCPDNNAKVDISNCAFSQDVGAAELKTFWSDPTFKVEQRAFYYVRALENPTCRWSTWDAVRNNVEPRSDIPKTIQERVWSSPIHYIP